MDQSLEILSEEESYKLEREKEIKQLEDAGISAYPHKFQPTISFKEYIKKYSDVETGSRHHDKVECIAGRVQEMRSSGKRLFFFTVRSNGHWLQYLVDKREYEKPDDLKKFHNRFHRGDYIGVRGFVGKSLRGELSIYALEMILLAPCLKYMPKLVYGLKDPEMRARKRYLDLIANPDSSSVFITRAKITSEIRRYLDDRDFIEVNTPILSAQAGGASAKPFITHHNDLKQDMYMRVAPELYLKELVVGGMDRVYEIGPQFRNEGIDTTHQPEFYSLEYYMAYADYNDLMRMCEEMITRVVMMIHGNLLVEYQSLDQKDPVTIDFTTPYKMVDMMSELEKKTGITFPENLESDEAREIIDKICLNFGIECSAPRTTARLLDKLVAKYIEPECINPTYICNHPMVMSPLAKQHRNNPHLSERFELFVCGMELANAYTELNNPKVQKERFQYQQKDKNMGDVEAQVLDKTFIDALEYGLPPTGGFGMGMDRLIMLMTNKNTIRDVITFPTMAHNIIVDESLET